MPHVSIEYSANVAEHHDIQALVDVVHAAALTHGLASPSALRTRAIGRDHYRVADGAAIFGFVAIHARVGPGRAPEEKRTFIEELLDAAQVTVGDSPLAIAWSIELTEINPEFRINRNGVRAAMEAG